MPGNYGERLDCELGVTEVEKKELNANLEYVLLKLNNQDIARKKVVMAACLLYVVVFISFALMQSNALNLTKNQLVFFSNLMDYLALFLCLAFFLTGLYGVLYIEKEREKINRKLSEEKKEKDDGKAVNKKSKSKKVADFCDKYASKVDLLGACLVTGMQAVVVFSLTIPYIFDHSKIPCGTAFSLQGIVDTIGNILFLIAAGMLLSSYLIKCRKNQDNKKSKFDATTSFIMGSLFCGSLLVLAGKILLSFEARQGVMYTGTVGPFGMDIFPLGLIVRAVGMIIFCAGYAVLLASSIKQNENLEKEYNSRYGSISASTSMSSVGIECNGKGLENHK